MKTLAVLMALSAPETLPHSVAPPQQMAGVMCFFKYEETSGMNKICFYDCLGSKSAITISAVKLCPLTIEQ